MTIGDTYESAYARLVARCERNERTGCLEDRSSRAYRYPMVRMGSAKDGSRRAISGHRLAYIVANGSIPDGMSICHKCDNTRCVEQKHLFAGTHSDNMRDMINKGRARHEPRRGSDNVTSKLNEDIVTDLRQRYAAGGVTYRELSEEFGVDISTLCLAIKGKTWKHVPMQ